ncbi:hypothetical protein [Streptomyces sp. NPDC056527]|uniref:hypothetical protein n=1 Tax=Streptomyces sp. NPDC056527 TaxID=3345853 RepID=UPI00368051EB
MAALLARFDLRGVVVTADAMHTKRKTAKKIVAGGGHYLPVARATRRSCGGNCAACPGGRCRCWTVPAPPGMDIAKSGG